MQNSVVANQGRSQGKSETQEKPTKTSKLRGAISPLPVCGISKDQVYLAEEIEWRCRMSSRTLKQWIDDGLPVAQPGTKDRFILGEDVIEFLRNSRDRLQDNPQLSEA